MIPGAAAVMPAPHAAAGVRSRRWRGLALGAALAAIATVAVLCLAPAGADAEPYRDLSDAGSEFLGVGRELADPDSLATVRIGVTGPALTTSGRELVGAVQLAIDEANAGGGYRGIPFELVHRPNDGPWGVVAKQVVRLAAEDEVWVIIGTLDGERAHAAELVVAKLWVPVLTPVGDHTVDYANVPWVFRGLPDDLSQVEALLALAAERGWHRLVLVSEIWRDAEQAARRVRHRVAAHGIDVALHHRYETYRPEVDLERLASLEADALVLWGRPDSALPVLRRLRALGVDLPLLLPSLLAVPEVAACPVLGPALAAAPYDLDGTQPELAAFRQRWVAAHGEEPSYVAPLAYDMARFALQALGRTGLNRARLRDELAGGGFQGLTGPFNFNSLGGRRQLPVALAARRGRWQSP